MSFSLKRNTNFQEITVSEKLPKTDPQRLPNDTPKPPKGVQGTPQDSPKWSQELPRTTQSAAKNPQEPPKVTQRRSKRPLDPSRIQFLWIWGSLLHPRSLHFPRISISNFFLGAGGRGACANRYIKNITKTHKISPTYCENI